MTKVLIVEDKQESREVLARIVREIDEHAVIYTAAEEDAAYIIAMKQNIDVFLVDIILHPERTGDQAGAVFAQHIREVEKYFFTPIIFITTLYDSGMSMLGAVQCYGFIEKPFDIEKTKEIITNAMRYHTAEKNGKRYIFHMDGLLGSVYVRDIIYIKSEDGHLRMRTMRENITIHYKSCRGILKELNSDRFEKCNRSTIVNMDYIRQIDAMGRYIYLRDCDDVLEIGSSMKDGFVRRYKERDV